MPKNRVIVIAASAGGLDAVRQLASALPADFPAPVIAVLHTSRDDPGLLAEIIGQSSKLHVSYARSGEIPAAGQLLLAPPDRHLRIDADGRVALDDGPKIHDSRPAANPLFESAAAFWGADVIGVVLTGEDHDGADGLVAIKAAGGISLVQDPDEAVDPSMPNNAIENDSPDFCGSIATLADLLGRLVRDKRPQRRETIDVQ